MPRHPSIVQLASITAISAAWSLPLRAEAASAQIQQSSMITPGGSTATMRIVMTIQTSLGSSTDDDIKTMATTGTASAVFVPITTPFGSTQFNALQLNFASTTFTFQFFCIPFIGCQTLNVNVQNLQFTLVDPACSAIAAGTGAVAFSNAIVHTTGTYSTSGIASTSGALDSLGVGNMTGRITNPTSSSAKLDQLFIAPQTFVADPASLPAPLTGMTVTVEPTLTNTTLSGRFAPVADTFDDDNDGIFNACDTCTDSDGDGLADAALPTNTCPVDNCPGVYNPDQLDHNSNGIGDACECPPDVAPVGIHDGLVNIDDLVVVITSWGQTGLGLPADCTHNGVVDIDDLVEVITGWGVCP